MKGSDVTSALQLLAAGRIDPIRGLGNFNKKMGAIWEIFDLLGVEIETSGGFTVTESNIDVETEKNSVVETEKNSVPISKPVKVCHICNKSFLNRFALKRHARAAHRPKSDQT